jgi:pilus assembly protein Flp/PilA
MLSLYMKYRNLKDCLKNQEGQGLVEYALIIVLISLAVLAAQPGIVGAIQGVYTTITNFLTGVGAPAGGV